MNCTQIEKLLPLYAGHDLDERREQSVATHLQTCTACTVAAADYREARELVRGLAPPAVGDDVYSEIRNSVWRRIEAEVRPTFFESMAFWFRPQFVWATATAALLITVSIVGIYFVVRRNATRPEIAVDKQKDVIQHENHPDDRRASGNVNPREENPRPRQAGMRKEPKPDRMTAPDRANSIGAYPPDTQVVRNQPSSPIIGRDDLDFPPTDSEKSLRMEIQTKNPNIRIIWFAKQEPKPGHAKGI